MFLNNLCNVRLILLLILSLSSISYASNEIIYSTSAKKNISYDELISELTQVNIVLIGEKHDEKIHHSKEYQLLYDSRDKRKNGSVLLEMFNASQQQKIDNIQQWILSGKTIGSQKLPLKLDWNKWDWDDYKEVITLVLNDTAKVLAATPKRVDIKGSGSFVPESTIANRDEVRQALASIMSVDKMDTLVGMQQYKDDYISQLLLDAPKPAWVIVGAIHASKLLGVPLYMKNTDNMKVIILTSHDTEIDIAHADYIWYLD